MRLRKWFVRGLVFTILALMVGAVILYQHWTNPAVVRQQVISALEEHFPNTDVKLEGARLRILGGIWLNDLRIVRRDDAYKTDLAYIPSGVVYHDKEKLLDGRLNFRKVELYRPRIHLIRFKDGKWNFENLTGKEDLTQTLPTVVIREGTLLIEDRTAAEALPLLEISDIDLTLINDPVQTLKIEATGVSHILGKLQLAGSFQRDTGLLDLDIQTKELQVSNALVRRLAGSCPTNSQFQGLTIQAQANGELHLKYDPRQAQPLDYDIHWRLYDGQFSHPQVPLPIENLQIDAVCENGHLTVRKLTGSSGKALIEARGKAIVPCVEQYFEGEVKVRRLPICKEFCSRLPESIRELESLFKPEGPVTVTLQAKRQEGQWLEQRCLLQPENMKVNFQHFPYPVKNMTGTLDVDLLTLHTKIDLTAYDYPRTIELKGYWIGEGDDAEADLHLCAREVPIDDNLIAALPESLQDLTRSFHPQGFINATARIFHAPGTEEFCNEYHAEFYDASVSWDGFPYLLERVTGKLDIYPEHWEFRNFHGVHNQGDVYISGRSYPSQAKSTSPANRIVIGITGKNIGIDKDLRQALIPLPSLAKAWDSLVPKGQLNFQAAIEQIPGHPQDMDIALDVHGCSLNPTFFTYPLQDLSGHFRLTGNRLTVRTIQARHMASQVSIEKGTVDLSPGGGFYADLRNVQGNPIFPTDGFLEAMPGELQDILNALQVKDPVALQTRIVVAQDETPGARPDVFWDGQLWLKKAKLNIGLDLEQITGTMACVGRHNGHQLLGLSGNVLLSEVELLDQPFKNVHAKIQIPPETPDVLLVGLKAPLFKGNISGEARVDFNSVLRYEMNLTASQIDLGQFGKHNLGSDTELNGLASARLYLMGQGSGVDSLDGHGSIDIPAGKLYNLPFLLDLLKFLGFRWPDRTAFEQAHAKFSIHGPRFLFHKLDLWGNAISLKGKGGVNLDGTEVDLEFYPSWARMEQLVEQLLPPAIHGLSPAVSKNLLKIEVEGKLGGRPEDLKFHKRPVPVIVDPLRDLHNRVVGIRKKED